MGGGANGPQVKIGYILQQDLSSMLFKFFQLQVENPTKGDWESACLKDLKELRINESFEEIKKMSKEQFNKILKKRIYENALCYLRKNNI